MYFPKRICFTFIFMHCFGEKNRHKITHKYYFETNTPTFIEISSNEIMYDAKQLLL